MSMRLLVLSVELDSIHVIEYVDYHFQLKMSLRINNELT